MTTKISLMWKYADIEILTSLMDWIKLETWGCLMWKKRTGNNKYLVVIPTELRRLSYQCKSKCLFADVRCLQLNPIVSLNLEVEQRNTWIKSLITSTTHSVFTCKLLLRVWIGMLGHPERALRSLHWKETLGGVIYPVWTRYASGSPWRI